MNLKVKEREQDGEFVPEQPRNERNAYVRHLLLSSLI
jgi:hypothetical protein